MENEPNEHRAGNPLHPTLKTGEVLLVAVCEYLNEKTSEQGCGAICHPLTDSAGVYAGKTFNASDRRTRKKALQRGQTK